MLSCLPVLYCRLVGIFKAHNHVRLLNYTPQGMHLPYHEREREIFILIQSATLVRLLTINSVNAYITSWVLYLSGGSEDPRLLLPAWISIASVIIRQTPEASVPRSDYDIDINLFVPSDPSSTCDTERDLPVHICLLYCQLHKHG